MSDRVLNAQEFFGFGIALDTITQRCHKTSTEKGFYDDKDVTSFTVQAEKLCLIHSEVTEVMEALRKNQGEQKVVEEMADILIRLFDFYQALLEAEVVESDLATELVNKMEKNAGRPHMHGVRG